MSAERRSAFFFVLVFSIFLLPHAAFASALTKPVSNLGLVGYWKFDEGTTTQAGDSSGYGNTGTLSGSTIPSWVSGKFGKALSFDGNTSYVNVNNAGVLSSPSMTTSMWFTLTADPECDANNNWRSLIRKGGTSGATTGWDVVLEQNKFVQFDVGLAGVTSRSGGINVGMQVGVPIFLTFTYDATTGSQQVWANGVSKSTKSNTPTSIGSNTTALTIAGGTAPGTCPNGSGYTPGKYDDVRVYSRALSATEVLNLYQYGGAGAVNHSNNLVVPNGLVGLWSFDNGDITWKSGTTGTAYDRSGNGNNGVLTNMKQSTSPAIGKIGQALKFNDSNSFVNIGSPSVLNVGSALTYSAWIKRTTNSSYNWPYILISGSTHTYYGIRSQSFGDNITFEYGTSPFAGATFSSLSCGGVGNLPVGEWRLFTFTYNGSTLSCYRNGVFISSVSGVTLNPNISAISVGADTGGAAPFAGFIDDARIYNRALTAAEAKQLYLAGSAVVNHSTNLGLNSGLVGLWSFDGKDTNWGTNKETDGSGNGNTGTLIGMSTTTSPTIGKIGQALKFSSGYISIADASSLDPTSAVTVSVWARINNTGIGQVVSKYDSISSLDPYAIQFWSDGKVYGNFKTTGGVIGAMSCAYSANVWYHVVATYDGTIGRLYLNGTQCATQSVSGTIVSSAKNLYIGSSGGSGLFKGTIDDARVYNRALSATEVKQLYNMGK